jgi:hypothetical protein
MTTKRLYKKKDKITVPRSLYRLFPEITKAYDADKNIEVKVTAKDCKVSTKKDPTECALAKAFKRELKVDKVIIGLTSSYIITGDTAIRFHTPENVAREIISFDRHHDFEPGEYTLRPKSKSAKMGSVHKSSRRNNKGGANKTATRHYHKTARVRAI